MELLKVLCLGDVVGRPGRGACTQGIPRLRESLKLDFVLVNAENASGGLGLDPESALEIRRSGADVITLGDHSFQRKEIRGFLNENSSWCIRPANYPEGAPGRGWTVVKVRGELEIGVSNLLGRVFIGGPLDCPFRCIDGLLAKELNHCRIRILDMHAEATSEKIAMGRYVDGRISLQVGTHTHVRTADAQILLGGTGYITDLGMTGSADGVIGMSSDVALARLIGGLPHAYKVAEGAGVLNGVLAEIDIETGRAVSVRGICAREDGSLI